MQTTFNKERRTVETILGAGNGVRVSITTTHNKERRAYYTSIYRERVVDGFVRFAVVEDCYGRAFEPVGRYSAKGVQAEHEAVIERFVTGDETALIAWAQDVVG